MTWEYPQAIELIASGKIQVAPLITAVASLEEDDVTVMVVAQPKHCQELSSRPLAVNARAPHRSDLLEMYDTSALIVANTAWASREQA